MAKVSGVATQISGKVGGLVFAQTKNGTVVYEAPAVKKTPRRSEQQMSTRMQWANLGATYMLFDGTLKRGFEGLPSTMSVYNAFIQSNLGVVKVYITKSMRLNGGCVLAPYQITRGSLASIMMAVNESGVLVSGLSVGSLVISATTTVAEFSQAIIANNAGWQVGDQLTFFLGRQQVDAVTSIPRATLTPNKVVMDVVDETPLWNVCGSEGFTSVSGELFQVSGYVVGMSDVLTAGAAAWVHSREMGTGGLKVSTQFFYVENAALASYQTSAALMASANSYGGINTSEVYLKPTAGNGTANSSGSGESAGGSQGGGSDNGSGESSQTGQSGGGAAEALEAPVISGTTPFTESTSVSISGPEGASIYYTTDGSVPTGESTAYSEAFSVTETTSIKAIAIKDGVSSEVSTKNFVKDSAGDNSGGFEMGS